MRVVVDTNVIVSALIFDGVPEQAVLEILVGGHALILSPFIIEEISRTLSSKFGVSPQNIRLHEELMSQAEIQYFQPFLDVLRDNSDNRVLETAVKGQADIIVTGDKLLLELGSYGAIKVATPAGFFASIH